MTRRTVLIVEGHEIVRRGLADMVHGLPDVELVGALSTIIEAVVVIRGGLDPDVVVLTSNIDPHQAEPITSRRAAGELAVLVLLRGLDSRDLDTAVHLGADGFLLESCLTLETLATSLNDVGRGQTPMPSPVARHLLDASRSRFVRDMPERLFTAREHDVVKLLIQGMSNKQIGHHFGISQHGAKRHVASILAKLGCPNRTKAVARVLGRVEEESKALARR